MAYEADTPDNEDGTDGCDGPTIDPQYIADRERDIRMCCVRTALDMYRPGDVGEDTILSAAQRILDFVNGGSK